MQILHQPDYSSLQDCQSVLNQQLKFLEKIFPLLKLPNLQILPVLLIRGKLFQMNLQALEPT